MEKDEKLISLLEGKKKVRNKHELSTTFGRATASGLSISLEGVSGSLRDAPLRPSQLSVCPGTQTLGSESTLLCHSLRDHQQLSQIIQEFGQ